MGVTIGRIDPDNGYTIVCSICGGASDWDVTFADYNEDPKKYDNWMCPVCARNTFNWKRRINNLDQKVEGTVKPEPILIYCDGGCHNNGSEDARAYGSYAVKYHGALQRIEHLEFPEIHTSNQAEYKALISVLDYLESFATRLPATARYPINIYMDSALITHQTAGVWKVKNDGLRPLFIEAVAKLRSLREKSVFVSINIDQVPRDKIVQVLGH